MRELKVEWTGSYPHLYFGEWIIKYGDLELDIPKEYKHSHMNTYGEYSSWYFDESMCEQDEYYTDGLNFDEWINENRNWITDMFKNKDIEVTNELLSDLFYKIQECDWRDGSCGGCI